MSASEDELSPYPTDVLPGHRPLLKSNHMQRHEFQNTVFIYHNYNSKFAIDYGYLQGNIGYQENVPPNDPAKKSTGSMMMPQAR